MAKQEENPTLSCIGAIALVPVLFVGTSLLSGWVGAAMWGWFISPTFHVQALTWWQATGIAMLFGFWSYQADSVEKSTGDADISFSTIIAKVIVRYPLCYFFAWLFHTIWH